MKLNNKGFSLVELFAVIFMTTLIIFPLITTLVNNITINDREQDRKAAAHIAQSTLTAINRITYSKIDALMTTANTSEYYIELNFDSCSTLSASPTDDDVLLCEQIFSTIWNNVSYTSTEFKVFIVNYNLPPSYQTALVNNNNIPSEVQDVIASFPTSNLANPELYRIIVWIRYDDEDNLVQVHKGLISSE